MKRLLISSDLSLPVDAVTEPLGMFANRGKGKSNAAHRFVEQLYHAGVPSIVIDVKGDWYGIRSSVDGAKAGLPFLIIGGSHGDVALEPRSGAIWARFLAEQRIPTIVDLSHFSKTQARWWVMEFAEELYRVNTEALMLVVDEADIIIPQRLANDLMRLLGAMEDIAKRGRQRGLGILVISQRVADVNKSVTDLLETLFLFMVSGAKNRKALLEWIDDHGDPDEARAVIATLSSLEPGECWVWSPGWLRILLRFKWRRIETYDSHATPKVGETRRPLKTMADVDLAAVKEQMADTIERVLADDPKELRKRITVLEKQIKGLETQAAAVVPEVIVEKVPVVDATLVQRVEEAMQPATELLANLLAVAQEAAATVAVDRRPSPPSPRTPSRTEPTPKAVSPPRVGTPADTSAVNEPRQKILNALAWYANVGVAPVSRSHVAFVAGTSPNSSGFEKNLSVLRTAGLIDYPSGGMLRLTAAGEQIAESSAEIATTEDLLDTLESRLGKPKGRILRTLVDEHPEALTRADLADRVEVSVDSSGFEKNLSGLRTLGLIDYPAKGYVVALPILFLEPT